MLNIIGGGLIAIACVLIGIAIKKHYSLRRDAYSILYDFVIYLHSDVAYLKKSISEVICEFCGDKKTSVHNALRGYTLFLKKNSEENFIPDIQGFKEEEKKELSKFLSSIGKHPLDETLNEIKREEKKYFDLKEKTEIEAKKLGGMYFKLLTLLGLATMLILA